MKKRTGKVASSAKIAGSAKTAGSVKAAGSVKTAGSAKAAGSAPRAPATDKRADRQKKVRFKVGDYLVYPMHGVGEVTAISKQVILGKRRECYIVDITSNKMRVMIPLDKEREIGIRSIIGKREVRKVLELLKKDEVDTEEDWKIRYQNNMNKIKSGNIYSVAEVCRNLYKRACNKELSLMERRLYEAAYSLISVELALSQNMSPDEAGNMISEILA